MPAFAQDQTSSQPALAPAPTVYITRTGPGAPTQILAIPKTSAEVQALRSQKEQLSEELSSVASQRHALSEEIRVAPDGASRTGLEARLRLMDQRILQLEGDIAATSKQLSSTPAELIAVTASETPPPSGDDWAEGLAFGVGFALLGMVIVFAYRRFRRRRSPAPQANMLGDSAQRLERLEHGMEAIAIEIERVSEGQRFVTKLLSEQAPVGALNRIAQPKGERQPSEA
jgi:hypothetical protein